MQPKQTQAAKRIMKDLDAFISYYQASKGMKPKRVVLTLAQLADLFGDKRDPNVYYKSIPVVSLHAN